MMPRTSVPNLFGMIDRFSLIGSGHRVGSQSANVAKLVDALDLGSSGVTLGSSSLPIRTNSKSELCVLYYYDEANASNHPNPDGLSGSGYPKRVVRSSLS